MKNKAAQSLGRKGGQAKSEAKALAARSNGAAGGRPPLPLKMVEEVAIRDRIYSQLWQRGESFAHVVFYIRDGQTRSGKRYARGNTEESVRYVASWVSEPKARRAHERFCDDRA